MSCTLAGVVESLPNGLHDAEVRALNIDYANGSAVVDLDVWVGNLDSADRAERELYRPARLSFSRLGYWVMEAPDENYNWDRTKSLSVDVGEGKPPGCNCVLPEPSEGLFLAWFYLPEHNRFWHVAAASAALDWTGAEFLWPAD